MAFTTAAHCAKCKDGLRIKQAQRRLLRAYRRLGTWRAVGAKLGVNHGYIVALVNRGTVPSNPNIRHALGLPKVMPSERKPRVYRVIPVIGTVNGWEKIFFKKPRPYKG